MRSLGNALSDLGSVMAWGSPSVATWRREAEARQEASEIRRRQQAAARARHREEAYAAALILGGVAVWFVLTWILPLILGA